MGHRHGKAEVRQMWETVHARYSSMRYEVPIIVAEGDKVAAHIRAFFRKRSNDRIVQFDIAAFYTLRDGRIAQIREIIDTFDLVAAGARARRRRDADGAEAGRVNVIPERAKRKPGISRFRFAVARRPE